MRGAHARVGRELRQRDLPALRDLAYARRDSGA